MKVYATEGSLTLELTGPLERLIGENVVQLPVVEGTRLGDALATLVERFPQLQGYLSSADALRAVDGPLPPGFLVIRGGAAVPARLETPVAAGERLTLLSMISGG